MSDPRQSIREGSLIAGKYQLVRPLTRGGMGSVWSARHVLLDAEVAVKFLDFNRVSSPEARARFEREARASAKLRSPYVAQVHDYGVDSGAPYIVMELLRGEDLGARLAREGRLSLHEARRILKPVCLALRAAHEAGLVHRDLKPANVFLSRHYDEEIVKVLDFGVAKTLEEELWKSADGTQSGALVGSPHYMSPEQVRSSKHVDHRTDLWSVGVLLFRCLTGRLPFPSEELGEVLVEICVEPIPRASSILPELSASVDRFFERAFTRDMNGRFQSARELLDAFTALAPESEEAQEERLIAVQPAAVAAPAVVEEASLLRTRDIEEASLLRTRDIEMDRATTAETRDGDEIPTLARGRASTPDLDLDDATVPAGAVSTAAIAWRFQGTLRMTVIAKAGFAFTRDGQMPRIDAPPLHRADVYHQKNPARSVRYPSDTAPYLASAQVVFCGSAHAMQGRITNAVQARLSLFEGDDVVIYKSLFVREPLPFQSVPLVYERALGGPGLADNPCGTGVDGHTAAPSILNPVDSTRPAGFGAIGPLWPARRSRLGDVRPSDLEAPILDLPDGFDWTYYCAAPPDQRVSRYLSGAEWIFLSGLHPEWAQAYMQLPGARGLARIHGLSAYGIEEGQPLVLHADMLFIDGDARYCSLTFRGVFEVPSLEALGVVRVAAGVELPGAPIAWPEVSARSPKAPSAEPPKRPSTPPREMTISLHDEDFERAPGNALAGVFSPPQPGAILQREENTALLVPSMLLATGPAIPFLGAAGPPKPPPRRLLDGSTLDVAPEQARAARLPFERKVEVANAPVEKPPVPMVSAPVGTPATPAVSASIATPATPTVSAAPATPATPAVSAAPATPATPAVGAAPATPATPTVGAAPATRPPSGSPWAAPEEKPPEAPKAPPPKPVKPSPPGATPELKQGLYGRFGGKG